MGKRGQMSNSFEFHTTHFDADRLVDLFVGARKKAVPKRGIGEVGGTGAGREEDMNRIEGSNMVFQNLQEVREDFQRAVAKLYDLFPLTPDVSPMRILQIEKKPEGAPRGYIISAQQCHWYENRGLPGARKAQNVRCPLQADAYPYFCALHVPLVYKNTEVKQSSITVAGNGLWVRENAAAARGRDMLVYEEGDVIAPYFGGHVDTSPERIADVKRSDYDYEMNLAQWTTWFNVRHSYLINSSNTQTSIARYATDSQRNPERINAALLPKPDVSVQLTEKELPPVREDAYPELRSPNFQVRGAHPWLVAIKNIYAGDEIFVSYGKSYDPTYYRDEGAKRTRIGMK